MVRRDAQETHPESMAPGTIPGSEKPRRVSKATGEQGMPNRKFDGKKPRSYSYRCWLWQMHNSAGQAPPQRGKWTFPAELPHTPRLDVCRAIRHLHVARGEGRQHWTARSGVWRDPDRQ